MQTRRERDMTMPKRTRFRRILKWSGLAMSLLTLAVWVASMWFWLHLGTYRWLAVHGGYVEVGRFLRTKAAYDKARGDFLARAKKKLGPAYRPPPCWRWGSMLPWSAAHLGLGLPYLEEPILLGDPGTKTVYLPLWLPFAALVFPTVIVFWLDRRRIPPGHCQTCGYNLTANVSGICPECGKPCEPDPSAT